MKNDTDQNNLHCKFMSLAINEAKKAYMNGEVPVGAIIVKNNQILSRSFNKAILEDDPTSHAEINAIREACSQLKNYRLCSVSLYVTLEPCAMCYGAIVHSRIKEVIFGAYDKKTGVCGSCNKLYESSCFNHRPRIIGGVHELQCSKLLKDFFNNKRTKK